jgi:hypothetical protein
VAKKKRKKQTSVPKKVLEGHRRIWGGTIPAGALAQLKREYARNPGRLPGTKKKSRRRPVGKRAAATRRKVARAMAARRHQNPPKMKRLKKSTGWMDATAVKIIKRRGKPDEVLIRKPARRRKSK